MSKRTLPITVSDHALVRFLERVGGVDMTTFKAAIAERVSAAMDVGATSVRIDGFTYVIDPVRRSVVTVTSPEQRRFRAAADFTPKGRSQSHE